MSRGLHSRSKDHSLIFGEHIAKKLRVPVMVLFVTSEELICAPTVGPLTEVSIPPSRPSTRNESGQ